MSDALAHGLAVPQALSAPGSFWDQFPGIVARYEPLLSTWRTSTAVKLDGQNYLTAPAVAADVYPITLFSWFRASTGQGGPLIYLGKIEGDVEYQGLNIQAGNVYASSGSSTSGARNVISASAGYEDNTWHFTAASLTETLGTLWVDGAAPVIDSTTITIPGGANVMNTTQVGRAAVLTPWFHLGSLQNPGVYRGTWTQAQYDWMRNAGKGRRWEDIPNNPVGLDPLLFSGWWPCDEFSGTRMNWGYGLGGNAIHLNAAANDSTNFPQPTDGVVENLPGVEDRALQFDATNDQSASNVGMIPNVTPPFSAAMWFRTPLAPPAVPDFLWTYGSSTTNNNYYSLNINQFGNLILTSSNASESTSANTSGITLTDNEWHLVVVVVDTQLNLYVDNNAPATGVLSVPAGLDQIVLAAWGRAAISNHWTGGIDEVMHFDSALNATDVTELLAAGAGVLAQDLVSGAVELTSGKTPIHAWALNSNDTNPGGAGRDIGTTGGITLTLNNSPTDTAGIPAGQSAGNGSVVTEWKNRQADNNHVTQATFAWRPRIVAVPDGYAMETDGVDDYMSIAAFQQGVIAQPTTLMAVLEFPVLPAAVLTYIDGGAINGQRLRTATDNRARINAGANLTGGTARPLNTPEIWVAVFNGVNSRLYINGGAPLATGDAGANSMTGIMFGALQSLTVFADALYRTVLFNDGELSLGDINEIGSLWASRYNIDWSEAT